MGLTMAEREAVSVKHVASPASLECGPFLRSVRARTGANVDSIGFEVSRWIRCSAGNS